VHSDADLVQEPVRSHATNTLLIFFVFTACILTYSPLSWLHPRNYFDYVHSRHTVMAIKDWPKLMRRTLE
jgi:hypothetical protein